ncbi:MAG: 50S ribosomal protein L7/L12 [Planctomycetota bacterium]
MSDSAVLEQDLKDIGDKIANLTLKQAKALSDYLESAHGIKPAAGGAVVMAAAPGAGAAEAAPAKTEFDVVMSAHGDKKLEVVKVVRQITAMDLMGAKKLVDNPPATIKQGVSEDEAKKVKAELEAAGATVELK